MGVKGVRRGGKQKDFRIAARRGLICDTTTPARCLSLCPFLLLVSHTHSSSYPPIRHYRRAMQRRRQGPSYPGRAPGAGLLIGLLVLLLLSITIDAFFFTGPRSLGGHLTGVRGPQQPRPPLLQTPTSLAAATATSVDGYVCLFCLLLPRPSDALRSLLAHVLNLLQTTTTDIHTGWYATTVLTLSKRTAAAAVRQRPRRRPSGAAGTFPHETRQKALRARGVILPLLPSITHPLPFTQTSLPPHSLKSPLLPESSKSSPTSMTRSSPAGACVSSALPWGGSTLNTNVANTTPAPSNSPWSSPASACPREGTLRVSPS